MYGAHNLQVVAIGLERRDQLLQNRVVLLACACWCLLKKWRQLQESRCAPADTLSHTLSRSLSLSHTHTHTVKHKRTHTYTCSRSPESRCAPGVWVLGVKLRNVGNLKNRVLLLQSRYTVTHTLSLSLSHTHTHTLALALQNRDALLECGCLMLRGSQAVRGTKR